MCTREIKETQNKIFYNERLSNKTQNVIKYADLN